jgi:hypothetical protein
LRTFGTAAPRTSAIADCGLWPSGYDGAMSERVVSIAMAIICAVTTTGLTFAFVRRRQTGSPYLLSWRISARTHGFIRPMFFKGSTAEASRILMFATATFICLSAAFA